MQMSGYPGRTAVLACCPSLRAGLRSFITSSTINVIILALVHLLSE